MIHSNKKLFCYEYYLEIVFFSSFNISNIMLKPCIFYFMRGGSVDSFEKAKKYEIQCQSFDTGDDVEGWRFWRQLFESIEKGWECDPYARCHIRHRASPMSSNSQIYFLRKIQISPRDVKGCKDFFKS